MHRRSLVSGLAVVAVLGGLLALHGLEIPPTITWLGHGGTQAGSEHEAVGHAADSHGAPRGHTHLTSTCVVAILLGLTGLAGLLSASLGRSRLGYASPGQRRAQPRGRPSPEHPPGTAQDGLCVLRC